MRKITTSVTPKESDEQYALFRWAAYSRVEHPELELMFHIPNGGSRNPREAHNLKLQGVKPGVPDIFLPVARQGYHGLWIELKREKGGVVSAYQSLWIKMLREQGYQAVVCRGYNEAVKTIETYLGKGGKND